MLKGLTFLALAEAGAVVRRSLRALGFSLAALGAVGVGAGFLLFAGHDWLAMRYDPQSAKLIIGAGALLIALVLLMMARLAKRGTRRYSIDRTPLGAQPLLQGRLLAAPLLLLGAAAVGALFGRFTKHG